jgi:hypothetical protein
MANNNKNSKSNVPSISDAIKDAKIIENLQGRLLWIKIGDEDHHATEHEISELTEKVEKLFADHKAECMVLVTHHAMDIKLI